MTLTSPMVPKANIGLILFNENYLNDYFIDLFTHFWRRKWQLTPVFLPGETYGQRATVQKVAKSQKQLKRLSTHSFIASVITRYLASINTNLQKEDKLKSLFSVLILLDTFQYPFFFFSFQFSSVAQSYPALCNPMNHSTPGLPVHDQLPEFTQTHVHLVSDAIQPSHPLSSPSPPAPNPSQHQSLFQ